jgi:hypothetical protein
MKIAFKDGVVLGIRCVFLLKWHNGNSIKPRCGVFEYFNTFHITDDE